MQGLDPASRRNLWDVVRANKEGRSIILTTHSMEEAETLCDRLGIFVNGQLICLGNPKEITSRYAGEHTHTHMHARTHAHTHTHTHTHRVTRTQTGKYTHMHA